MLGRLVASGVSRLPQAVSNPRVALNQAIADSALAPVLKFWESLREMEAWWPVLIPALLWVFWRTYQRERAELAAEREQS